MDYDQKVCRILEDLDKCVFDCLNSSQCETEDNEDSLMDEAVLPCLLMSKDANKNLTLPDPQKNVKVEQNVTIIKSETVTDHIKEECVLNQSDEENLSSKQIEETLQHESSDGFEEMRYKPDRIDVLVILENDRRKVINMKRYSKVKHLRKKFLKIIHKDPVYTEKVEVSKIIFQTYHDKFKTWVDAEKDLILTDGMNLKVIFACSKTQKEKESKRSYTNANSEDHDNVKNHSPHKSKKLKSSVSRLEKARSPSPLPRFQRSWSPPSRLFRSIQSYSYYEKRDHKSDRSEKSWHTSKYDFDPKRGNLRKAYMDDYSKSGRDNNGAYQVATTYNKNRPSYNKLPHSSSFQEVNKTQSYSEELNNFLKMVEKQKNGMNEPAPEKVNEEEVIESSSQNEDEEVTCEETVQSCEETVPSTINEGSCEEVHYILLTKKEIELYSARLRINEKHPVQAVQEICMSAYKQPPLFEIQEDRCPLTKHMRYKYTLNVLGNIFTPDKTQFNKKSAKVDAANLFLKHVGFK